MTLLRARLGNWRIGMRIERLPHTLVIRSLFSHIADTRAVCNTFKNTDMMCPFIDFDDKVPLDKLFRVMDDLINEYTIRIHLFQTSENHFNAISTTLLPKRDIDEIMIRYMKYMDYRYVYVYNRDGYNAIRLVPKLVDGRMLRPIKYITSSGDFLSPMARIQHNGLATLLSDIFPFSYFKQYGIFDDSTKDDLLIRNYETINW